MSPVRPTGRASSANRDSLLWFGELRDAHDQSLEPAPGTHGSWWMTTGLKSSRPTFSLSDISTTSMSRAVLRAKFGVVYIFLLPGTVKLLYYKI